MVCQNFTVGKWKQGSPPITFVANLFAPPKTQKNQPHLPLRVWSIWQLLEAKSLLDVPAAGALTGLELYEPLVHRLQDGRIHVLHDVLQLVRVRRQVIHFYERLQTQRDRDWAFVPTKRLACGPPDCRVVQLPRCLRTRSIVGCVRRQGSAHRRRCCCRHLRTRSLGNIAEERTLSQCWISA